MNRGLLLGCGAILGVVLILAVIFGVMFMGGYNRMVTLNEQADTAWAQVENQLQRRFDLVPNLVETVKGFATQEKEIFTNIANARARIGSMGPSTTPEQQAERIQAEQQMSGFLSRLLVIAENYPQLRSNENFMALQAELAGTENRIAVERQRYNEAVRDYNLYVKAIPGRFYASLGGFEPRAMFEATSGSETAPRVNFGTSPEAPPQPAAPQPANATQ